MAIVEGPAFSLRASGNVGPICYANYPGRVVSRAAWSGTITLTTAQLIYAGHMAALMTAWGQTLSDVERAAWEQAARMKVHINRLQQKWTPSGYNLFLKVGMLRLSMTTGIQTMPPDLSPYSFASSVQFISSVIPTQAEVKMNIAPASPLPDRMQVFRAGPFTSPARHAQKYDYRLVRNEVIPFDFIDTGLTHLRYYWYKCRMGWLRGVVGNFFEGRVYVL